MIIAVNITSENTDNSKLIKYLEQYGKVDICKPIKSRQGSKLAKESYFLSLFTNSSLEDSKFIKVCRENNVILQLDVFQD